MIQIALLVLVTLTKSLSLKYGFTRNIITSIRSQSQMRSKAVKMTTDLFSIGNDIQVLPPENGVEKIVVRSQ